MAKKIKTKSAPSSRLSKIYDLARFDETNITLLKKLFTSCKKRATKHVKDPSFYKKRVLSRIPILDWLPKYKIKKFLLADTVAGITVGVMNIPQVKNSLLIRNFKISLFSIFNKKISGYGICTRRFTTSCVWAVYIVFSQRFLCIPWHVPSSGHWLICIS